MKDGIAMAGATAMMGVSPAPTEGRSGRLSEMDVEFGNVFIARHLITGEKGVLHFAVFESHFFAQGRAETHDDRAVTCL